MPIELVHPHPPQLPLPPNIHKAARDERSGCVVLRGKYGGRGSAEAWRSLTKGLVLLPVAARRCPAKDQCHTDTMFLGTSNHLSFMDRIVKSMFARI